MLRLNIAIREWNSIAPKVNSSIQNSTEIEFWLSERVCSAVAELMQRGDFKRLAKQPLDLIHGSSSPARQLVNEIDDALVDTAKSLYSILCRPSVELVCAGEHVTPDPARARNPGTTRAIDEVVEITQYEATITSDVPSNDRTHKVKIRRRLATPDYTHLKRVLSEIAARPWLDLACEDDYFASTTDLNLKSEQIDGDQRKTPIQIGSMLPILQPSLRYGGDFIFQCMLLRISHWKEMLRRISDAILEKFRASHKSDLKDAQDIRAAWRLSQRLIDDLHSVYRLEKVSLLRDACITLLQTYASYRNVADLRWLGLNEELWKCGKGVRLYVEKGDQRMVYAIGDALLEVRRGFDDDEDIESRIAELSRSHALCIIQGVGRRQVYWQGQKVDADWVKLGTPWALICDLAEKAKRGLGVDKVDVKYSLKDARYQLGKHIPVTFRSGISAILGGYKLMLEPAQICIQVFEEHESLKEL